ncbi:MAG: TetR/AcrR family transcriptional regulator [Heliobacteriaceae bacterium]|nr:TetR/AcrR family transcriptional regulator [Heliobacteriaceae bacterium]MDD4588146.1 TetR/AcrR family transcriptional regulator [Heliobacteriaceae bacterium]
MEKTSKKDLIADAALNCFLSSGYSGTSMDEIVKASGISKGGIYWHFKSKDEIFLYIIQKRFSDWDQDLLARLKGVDSTKEALSKFVDFFLEIIVAPLLALTYEFLLYTKDKETLDRVYKYTNRSHKNVILTIIQDGINNGELKTFDPEITANVFIGIIEGISLQWFTQHNDKKTLERSAKTALHIFFTGISK